jgi:uncharacterized protein
MVDFCLQPAEDMYRLCLHEADVIWIDHHSSAIRSIKEIGLYPVGRQDTSKAACELTWEYLFPGRPVPLAVKLLSLYDSWTYQGHELEEMVLPFQMRMRMEDLDPKDWECCGMIWNNLFTSDTLDDLIEEGRLLLRYDEQQKKKYARTYAFETILQIDAGFDLPDGLGRATLPLEIIALNLGHTNSKVFDSVYDPEKHDLMITFVRRSDRLWNVSLYSTKPEIDCGAIAKSFGGGGHKGAAGFQCKELPFKY